MFITSQMNAGELLAHFLDLRGAKDAETADFVGHGHNKSLCPRFQRNVDVLLETYSSYRTGVYDIQGFNDEGVDIFLAYETLAGERRTAGLQIKSHQEFEDWKNKTTPSMIGKLHEQFSRANLKRRIDDYYIVLCADAEQHRDRIRMVASDFASPNVKVITPSKALPFFSMSELELALEVTHLLCADDPLLMKAQQEMENRTSEEAHLLINLVCRTFMGEGRNSEDELFSIYDEWLETQPNPNKVNPDGLVDAVNRLEDSNVIQRIDGTFRVDVPSLPISLCAFYFDQRARLPSNREIAEHLVGLLRPR